MLFNIGYIIDDKYEILDLIGSGGFGEVYKARYLASGDFRAIKCLLPHLVEAHPEIVDMFDEEANAAMQVRHQNVVQIFSIEETNFENKKTKYFTMEYTEDGDLDTFIRNQDTFLAIDELKEYLKQLLLGLKAINEKLIHRDLKPENILLFGDVLKISDFGLSRYIEESTRTKTFKGWGTPQYMSPEVWGNVSPTPKVDQYSMGMIFYVLATLKHPFSPMPSSGNTFEFLRDSHLFKIPQHPKERNNELPDKLSSIIMRMIEKKPENRYESLDDILNALENIEEEDEADVSPEILEIAVSAKKSDNKYKEKELKKAEEERNRKQETERIDDLFNFHCRELISNFDKVIDSVNEQIEPIKIVKSGLPSYQLSYIFSYSFLNSQLKVHLEKSSRISGVENVIGWGYCFIHKYEDGFNLLLQKSAKEPYAKWLVVEVQAQAMRGRARHFKPHAVFSLDELNDALRGLHAIHIYQAKLQEFSDSMFVDLVKKLVIK